MGAGEDELRGFEVHVVAEEAEGEGMGEAEPEAALLTESALGSPAMVLSEVRDLERGRSFRPNRNSESLLYLAADRALSECVNLLLQSGVPLDFVGPNSRTALHAAVFRANKA
ncbi:hypothetical protein QJS10_CPB21g00840 [Acorus calamus]|uniref:Uncharacterized protein n=1 Tax=Acorus calamus TaxID=4465 RepID=A0AAV9C4Y5_ACOCL|nr:hypothetical protein QJS10_CPB21g00840 [Acorus calamus]